MSRASNRRLLCLLRSWVLSNHNLRMGKLQKAGQLPLPLGIQVGGNASAWLGLCSGQSLWPGSSENISDYMRNKTHHLRAAIESDYLQSVANARWPVLASIFSFDLLCFSFRFLAKLLGTYYYGVEGVLLH
jgi:hypothetical protein